VDVTPVVVHVGSFCFAYVAVYLTAGEPLTGGINAKKLADIAGWLLLCGLPWLCVGDFNATPAELAATAWFVRMGGRIVEPSNAQFTCTSGEGRMLDYIVASADLLDWIGGARASIVPWKPHLAIEFCVLKDHEPEQARVQIKPRTPLLPAVSRKHLQVDSSDTEVEKLDQAELPGSEGAKLGCDPDLADVGASHDRHSSLRSDMETTGRCEDEEKQIFPLFSGEAEECEAPIELCGNLSDEDAVRNADCVHAVAPNVTLPGNNASAMDLAGGGLGDAAEDGRCGFDGEDMEAPTTKGCDGRRELRAEDAGMQSSPPPDLGGCAGIARRGRRRR
jgi:hypothetical protein